MLEGDHQGLMTMVYASPTPQLCSNTASIVSLILNGEKEILKKKIQFHLSLKRT